MISEDIENRILEACNRWIEHGGEITVAGNTHPKYRMLASVFEDFNIGIEINKPTNPMQKAGAALGIKGYEFCFIQASFDVWSMYYSGCDIDVDKCLHNPWPEKVIYDEVIPDDFDIGQCYQIGFNIRERLGFIWIPSPREDAKLVLDTGITTITIQDVRSIVKEEESKPWLNKDEDYLKMVLRCIQHICNETGIQIKKTKKGIDIIK